MTIRAALLLLNGLTLLVGCAATGGDKNAPTVIVSSHVDSKSGDLIALWLPQSDNTLRPILVPCRYAVYIYWPSEEYYPNSASKRVFLFYDNVAKKSYQTRNYDAFLAIMGKQPEAIEVLQFETCSMPRCYMPDSEWSRLEAVMRAGSRRWGTYSVSGDRTVGFCYCETKGEFVYPGDKL